MGKIMGIRTNIFNLIFLAFVFCVSVPRKIHCAAKKPLSSNKLDKNGYSPFIQAVIANNLQSVVCLLELGQDVNNRGTIDGKTALIWTAIKGYEDIADVLLAHENINLWIRDKPCAGSKGKGKTTLDYALECGHSEIIEKILAKKKSSDVWKESQKVNAGKQEECKFCLSCKSLVLREAHFCPICENDFTCKRCNKNLSAGLSQYCSQCHMTCEDLWGLICPFCWQKINSPLC